MTGKPAPATAGLEGLAGALADVVCWVVFYLDRASDEEVDPQIADSLIEVMGDALRRLPVTDRLAFLSHASARAGASEIEQYQDFLLELAESLGLE